MSDEKIEIVVRDIPKRKPGRPTLKEDRGITPEGVLSAYWSFRSVRKTAKAMRISTTSVKKYLAIAGGPDRTLIRFSQPYPWFRKGRGPVWEWIANNIDLIAKERNLGKLSSTSGIVEEALKKALSRRKAIATSYLLAHGRIQDTPQPIRLLDLEGKWRMVKSISDFQIVLDRYSMGVRLKMLLQSGELAVTLLTFPETLALFRTATRHSIPLPRQSVLFKTIKADFPELREETEILPAAGSAQ